MTLDLVLQNGHFGDGRTLDLGIKDGVIAAIESGLSGDGESLDLDGALVTAGLVETHIHLDKSRILDRCTPPPVGVRDYMQRVADVKPTFTVEDVYNRARDTLEQCLLHGATLMRAHVEVDPNVDLVGFEALKQLAADYRWAIDIEFCVFAQEGLTNVPETDANTVAALKDGATVVPGGTLSKFLGSVRHVANYPRRGGLYVAKMKVRAPGTRATRRPNPKKPGAQGFGRQGAKR